VREGLFPVVLESATALEPVAQHAHDRGSPTLDVVQGTINRAWPANLAEDSDVASHYAATTRHGFDQRKSKAFCFGGVDEEVGAAICSAQHLAGDGTKLHNRILNIQFFG
jgi:hypothetical protein